MNVSLYSKLWTDTSALSPHFLAQGRADQKHSLTTTTTSTTTSTTTTTTTEHDKIPHCLERGQPSPSRQVLIIPFSCLRTLGLCDDFVAPPSMCPRFSCANGASSDSIDFYCDKSMLLDRCRVIREESVAFSVLTAIATRAGSGSLFSFLFPGSFFLSFFFSFFFYFVLTKATCCYLYTSDFSVPLARGCT